MAHIGAEGCIFQGAEAELGLGFGAFGSLGFRVLDLRFRV